MKRIIVYLRIYLILMSVHLRTAVMVEADFWLGVLGVAITQGAGIIFVWTVFQRIPEINGWNLWEVAFLYALVAIPRGLTELVCDGQWELRRLVYRGDFDRLLVRPVPPLLQVLCQYSSIHGLGGVMVGGIILANSVSNLDLTWSLFDVGFLVITIINGVVMISATNLLTNSFVFWEPSMSSAFPMVLIQSVDFAKFPISLYNQFLQFIFTWVIPFAFISYYPGLVLLRKDTVSWLAYLTPITGFLVAIIAYQVWKIGVNRYQSTGQ